MAKMTDYNPSGFTLISPSNTFEAIRLGWWLLRHPDRYKVLGVRKNVSFDTAVHTLASEIEASNDAKH